MNDYTDKLGNNLNDLLQKNYPTEKGFRKVAENAIHRGLKSYFTNKAKACSDFSQELEKGGALELQPSPVGWK